MLNSAPDVSLSVYFKILKVSALLGTVRLILGAIVPELYLTTLTSEYVPQFLDSKRFRRAPPHLHVIAWLFR